jgi:hypothetical protein
MLLIYLKVFLGLLPVLASKVITGLKIESTSNC